MGSARGGAAAASAASASARSGTESSSAELFVLAISALSILSILLLILPLDSEITAVVALVDVFLSAVLIDFAYRFRRAGSGTSSKSVGGSTSSAA